MKKLLLFFFPLFLLVITSCNDDDEPVYKWRSVWTEERLDPERNLLARDTIVDSFEHKTDEDAKVGVRFPASLLLIPQEKIVEENIITEGDYKERLIIYEMSGTWRHNVDYPYPSHLVKVVINYEKVND